MAMTERLTFTGSTGETLAARFERPDGPVRAYALFAHCFSCSKDGFAAARISKALGDAGIGVLRFDFTGLGQSDGDFANTTFSSNVADLVAAADALRAQYGPPALLVGHSLGGAAVIMAADKIPEARAVAVLGAPADVTHVAAQFADQLTQIREDGSAQVSLAGRAFTIKRDFVEDLEQHKVTQAAGDLRRALLILHAPRDETVSIDNATELFVSAKHPKSFVSLDDADHLLTRRADASYAASVIAAWAARYLDGEAADPATDLPNAPDKSVIVRELTDNGYGARMAAGHHRVLGDQPPPAGQDLGPDPYELLAMSLGLCTTQTLRMYAAKKGLGLDPVTVTVAFEKRHRDDCEACTDGKGAKVLHLQRQIALDGSLDEAARNRLLEIADQCPVHKTLSEHLVPITTTLKT